MKITKFGHSCLLVEEGEAKILIDPGVWSAVPELKNLDAILITHEHGDHFDVALIKKILASNIETPIYTNEGVAAKLKAEGIDSKILRKGEQVVIKGISVVAFGEKHEVVYKTIPVCQNVGFMVGGRLFHPGDSYELPQEPVAILALPVAAPWTDAARMLDYGLAVKPKNVFPIHDGFLKEQNPFYPHAKRELEGIGSKWLVLEIGKPMEF